MHEVSGEFSKEFGGKRYLSLHLILEGTLIGMMVGALVALFRLSISAISGYLLPYFEQAHSSLQTATLLVAIMIVCGLIAAIITKFEPMIGGSGIPQVSAQLVGRLHPHWYTVLPAKFFGGLMTLGMGLTMGREGPSVQIGATLGEGLGAVLKRPYSEKRYLLTCGAAAGLAAAFNAPIAGIVFALEELHKSFSPTVLVVSMAAAFSAVFVEGAIFGVEPVLKFYNFAPLPLHIYPSIMVLGLVTGLSGVLFNRCIVGSKKLYGALKIPWMIKYATPFLLTGLMCIWMPLLFGSGEHFIFFPVEGENPKPLMLLAIYLLQLALIMVAFGSGLPGGIFFPLLVLGALLGNAFGQVGADAGFWTKDMVLALSLLAMCGHFSAIVRSPLTGIILVSEMTSTFAFLLPLGIVALTSFIVAEFLRSRPIYETLQDMIPGIDQDTAVESARLMPNDRVLVEYNVEVNSPADGLRVADLGLPDRMLIISIRRGTSEIFPNSRVVIYGGDYLLCYQPASDMKRNQEVMDRLVREGDSPEAHILGPGKLPFEKG